MVRHTIKILQQMLQDFKSESAHFGTLCIKGLIAGMLMLLVKPFILKNQMISLKSKIIS